MTQHPRFWIIAALVLLAAPVAVNVWLGLARHSTEIAEAARRALP